MALYSLCFLSANRALFVDRDRWFRKFRSSLTEICIASTNDPGVPGWRTKVDWVIFHRARSFAQHRPGPCSTHDRSWRRPGSLR